MNKKNKYSIGASLSIIIGLVLKLAFDNLFFAIVGFIFSIVFFVKMLKIQ